MSLTASSYILGLDLGTNSVGFCLTCAREGKDGSFHSERIELMGARIFDAGTEGDIGSGRDSARNATRRDARMRRKQLERRTRRKVKLLHALMRRGLLPESDVGKAESRDLFFKELDNRLYPAFCRRLQTISPLGTFSRQLFPYLLRTAALGERLEAYEIGRAIYQLAQRRGFLSNRKAPPKKDEDDGIVKKSIGELAANMKKTGAATLGAYLAGLNPNEERIRNRWTARTMFLEEFGAIWATQRAHHPELLTDEAEEELTDAIFKQRKLKSQKGKIGNCELEPDRKRAAWAMPETQRFRLLQAVNNLEINTEHGEVLGLSAEQRETLVDALEHEGDLSFGGIKKLLGLHRSASFNLARGGDKGMRGNRATSKLFSVFGERWRSFSEDEKRAAFLDAYSMETEEALYRRGKGFWGLDEDSARAFSRVLFEPGYCPHSMRAIRRMLPLLESGVKYATAKKEAYPAGEEVPAAAVLPPVFEELPGLRNPIVARTLTEMRKTVNALIQEYGKPARIRVELARDLKKSRDDRKRQSDTIRKNERARDAARAAILRKAGISEPSRDDILKWQLAEECNWHCPYTGRQFGWEDLFGPTPTMDIEHIIPFSRCLDDSYTNKTLCDSRENKQVKRNRTPFEAYSGGGEWDGIVLRVKGFTGEKGVCGAKLRRFLVEDAKEYCEGFKSRQLNDTRYASKLAKAYLGALYGDEAPKRVKAGSGQVTAFVRGLSGLNTILGDGGFKTRDDHRHHAVDALAIALTDEGMIKAVSDSASRAREIGKKLFDRLGEPWPGFLEEARGHVSGLTVSFRPTHKVNGPLHEETFYSQAKVFEDGKAYPTVRKRLESLSKTEVAKIADAHIRALVEEMLSSNGGDPGKTFSNEANAIFIRGKDGLRRRVRKVRIKASVTPVEVGKGMTARRVKGGSNHHVAVFASRDAKGREIWEGALVSRYEAMRRMRRGEPVIGREAPGKGHFLFSLSGGDILFLEHDGVASLFRIRSISQKQKGAIRIEIVRIHDARDKKRIKASHDWIEKSLETLRKGKCQKMTVTPLGEIRRAND